MKFDFVITNPPYNDGAQSATKINGSKMASIGSLLPGFIKLACKFVKTNGRIIYVCPPSSEKYFRKEGKHVKKLGFIDNKYWGKRVAAFWWIVDEDESITNDIVADFGINKIFDYDPKRHSINRSKNVLYLYNFTTRCIVGINKKHYSDCKFNLTPTDLNVKNLTQLIAFIQPYMVKRINSWTAVNKKIKYEWLENLDYEITEKDIIQHYGLTEQEVYNIKNG